MFECESQGSVITRARSNRFITGINIDKDTGRNMKNITRTSVEHSQDGKHLSIKLENILSGSNSITRTKKMDKVDLSSSNVQLNQAHIKLQKSSTVSDENDKDRNSELPNLTASNDRRFTNKRKMRSLKRTNVTLTKNCITNVKGNINADQTTNIDMINTFKENASNLKESIVLVQKLHNILTIVLCPPSLSSSMVRVLVNDQFVNCKVNIPWKMYESLLSPLVTTETSCNQKTNSCIKTWQNEDNQHDITESPWHVQDDVNEPLPIMSSTPKDQQGPNAIAKGEASRFKQKCAASLELNTNNMLSVQCPNNGNVKMSEVQWEVKQQQNKTYELIEPQTPILRKKMEAKHTNGKRTEVKKKVKVHFINPSMDSTCGLKNNAQCSEEKSFKSLMNVKKQILKSPMNVRQRRSKSVSGRDDTTYPVSVAIPHIPCAKKNHSAPSFAKVNIVTGSPSVTNTRKSAKKVPNFATIHQNMFAKYESILDANKRLKDRHTALTMAKANNGITVKPTVEDKKQLPGRSNTANYSRFGFKTRKQEATEHILRHNNIHVTSSKERRRAILNGVRTNRRFEIQMKSRNINV